MIFKNWQARTAIGLLTVIVIAYNACSDTKFSSLNNTVSVGNPMAPVSNEVMFAMCGVINRCNPQVTLEQCENGLLPTSGFSTPLGVASQYNALSSIMTAEASGSLIGNLPAGSSCYDNINTLGCSNPLVQGAYVSTQPNPFSNAPNMIPTTSCNQVFSPGVNIEVPIEMVDYGVSSSTATATFSRTTTSLNSSNYDGTVTYSFEVVASNTDSVTRNVALVDSSGSTFVTIPVPAGLTSPTRLRASFTPTAGSDTYQVSLDGTTASNNLQAFEGRILVDQVGATQTQIFIPLTGSYPYNYSNADNSTAAVDDSIPGSGVYTHDNADYFSLWNKKSSAFSQLASGNPWTLEAVISTSTAGSTTAYASLFDYTTGLQITASEMTTTSVNPTLLTMNFPDSSVNFTSLNDMEIRIKNNGAGSNAWIYRSGLWVQLTNLTHAEVYYRYMNTYWDGAQSGEHQAAWNIALLNMNLFVSPTIFNEASGYVSATGTPCSEQLFDIGTNDSGTIGTDVTSSSLSFSSTSRSRARSPALTITSGDRFISDIAPNLTSGSCIIVQPRLVVGF